MRTFILRLQGTVQPTIRSCFVAGSAGFHKVLRVKMRARGIGRPNRMDDRQMFLVPQRLELCQGRVESEESIQILHLGLRDRDAGRAW